MELLAGRILHEIETDGFSLFLLNHPCRFIWIHPCLQGSVVYANSDRIPKGIYDSVFRAAYFFAALFILRSARHPLFVRIRWTVPSNLPKQPRVLELSGCISFPGSDVKKVGLQFSSFISSIVRTLAAKVTIGQKLGGN